MASQAEGVHIIVTMFDVRECKQLFARVLIKISPQTAES